MEISRSHRDAKVSLPFASSDELVSVEFENLRHSSKYVFGTVDPTPEDVAGDVMYVNKDTGVIYISDSDKEPVEMRARFYPETVSIDVPLEFINYCGKFNVKWTYEVDGVEHVENQQHDVIQPLFTPDELRAFDGDFANSSDNDIKRLERIVRGIIETVTGQSFELSYGVETVRSHNGGTLVPPKRVVSLDGYSGYVAGVKSAVESDGWIIRAYSPMEYTTKMYANPIRDTYLTNAFKEGTYRIRGEWGYRSVPERISLAAMLLAQEYGCRESAWRDKYVEQMKNVDWTVTFNPGAFAGTGNIKVDQILTSYTLNKLVVI